MLTPNDLCKYQPRQLFSRFYPQQSKNASIYGNILNVSFFGSGAGSIYLFYQVPSLPFLQGINEEALRTAVSFSVVMIIPTWMILFFAAMALLSNHLTYARLEKMSLIPRTKFPACNSFGCLQQPCRYPDNQWIFLRFENNRQQRPNLVKK